MFDIKLALQITQTVLSLLLIVAVMLHSAKGEGIGAMGAQTKIFGSQKGVEAGLNRFATIIAVLWGTVSLGIAYLTYH